jgi:restriction endonuclease S subunit
MNGSTIKHITKDKFNNFEIPIPKSEDKLNDWINKLSKPFDEKI